MDLREVCDWCLSRVDHVTCTPNNAKVCDICVAAHVCRICHVNKLELVPGYKYCAPCWNALGIATIIDKHLYLSDAANAGNYQLLQQYGIKQILTVGAELPKHQTDQFVTCHLSIDDHPSVDIFQHFEDCHEFINRAPTLVHCYAGVSRSVTVVLSYLIRYSGMTLEQAIEYCRQKRPVIKPNRGFIRQLREYEDQLEELKKEMQEINIIACGSDFL